jgi:hypothetical protein
MCFVDALLLPPVIFYNLSLSVYYVLVINYGYRESQLKSVRKFLHLPTVLGIALAFAGIPYYDDFLWICHIPSPPVGQSYLSNDVLVLVPFTTSIGLSAIAMFMVYIKVLRQTRSANRWRFGDGGGANGKLARKVFWQAFFFVVALYGSWPISLLAIYSGNDGKINGLYWFFVLTFTLAPLQGFFNFFVYFRPGLVRYFKQRRRRRRRQQNAPTPNAENRWRRIGFRFTLSTNGRSFVSLLFGSKQRMTGEMSPDDATSGPDRS